jgi:hypothetical protein
MRRPRPARSFRTAPNAERLRVASYCKTDSGPRVERSDRRDDARSSRLRHSRWLLLIDEPAVSVRRSRVPPQRRCVRQGLPRRGIQQHERLIEPRSGARKARESVRRQARRALLLMAAERSHGCTAATLVFWQTSTVGHQDLSSSPRPVTVSVRVQTEDIDSQGRSQCSSASLSS